MLLEVSGQRYVALKMGFRVLNGYLLTKTLRRLTNGEIYLELPPT